MYKITWDQKTERFSFGLLQLREQIDKLLVQENFFFTMPNMCSMCQGSAIQL